MTKTLTILLYEARATLRRRSFQAAAFGFPLVSLLVFGLLPGFWSSLAERRSLPDELEAVAAEASLAEGYVDQSGLIERLPAFVEPGRLTAYADAAAARLALQAGQIAGYYVIPPDYLENGQIVYVPAEFNPFAALGKARLMRRVLQVNLLGGAERLSSLLDQPLQPQIERRAPPPGAAAGSSAGSAPGAAQLESSADYPENNPWTFFLPYGATLLFYIIILMSSSLLLSSITKDKENRLLEILLVSSSARQILAGKIAGLGICGLLQAAAWLGASLLLLRQRGVGLPFAANAPLPGALLLAGLLYFLLGYALYASLMASIGALVPNLREASQLTIVLMIPLLAPLLMIMTIANNPSGLIAVALSIFPLTAPVTMIARLVATPVPAWQVLLSIALLVFSILIVVQLAARLFKGQMLVSGRSVWAGVMKHRL